ncbi:hypothetical protein TWF225_004380 [Orbilia oligospora]|uniref:Nephrocystin 3-like N-terminal domain-containing protein n=1 Tax=Orbilia oligospora TaxID=2813651 RepID=A0A7C8U400_ORBOL|nr:hypothetical protein TWF751_007263 [Orbilia oligospora]KAF3187226.1 hypothetical protein TWF225_004380 [Orbilia oligospora]KAF3260024.1 hypothetical protein TWF217_005049 [Orbilia oligospora]KAF3267105.1 hypothetical protein TWF128_010060 [Orbilia oligospora]KAF3293397.1 hypothetical protein TWF132_004717 [Orbilia oligospora]
MEAAGLMDDFPCIVIPGICDYADERKNDGWHEYAAGIAAAYAKDLLGRLQPIDIRKERPVKDLIFNQVYNKVKRITSRLEKEDDRKVPKRLTPMKYSSLQNDVIQKRQSGTRKWSLGSKEFNNCLQDSQRILFCPNIPRTGKTFLTSVIINQLSQLFNKTPTICIV